MTATLNPPRSPRNRACPWPIEGFPRGRGTRIPVDLATRQRGRSVATGSGLAGRLVALRRVVAQRLAREERRYRTVAGRALHRKHVLGAHRSPPGTSASATGASGEACGWSGAAALPGAGSPQSASGRATGRPPRHAHPQGSRLRDWQAARKLHTRRAVLAGNYTLKVAGKTYPALVA